MHTYTRAGVFDSNRFTPLSLPWLLFYQVGLSPLFQDAAMTTLVTADGDPVGAIQDLSAPVTPATLFGTNAARPTFKTGVIDSRPVLRYAGAQCLSTQDATVVPFTAGYMMVIINRTGGTTGDPAIGGRNSGTGVPIFLTLASDATTAKGYDLTRLRNDANAIQTLASDPASGWACIETLWDGTTLTRYRGGVSRGSAAIGGTVSLNRFGLGCDLIDSTKATGDLALAAVMTSAPSAYDLARLRAWVKATYPSVPMA